MARHSAESARHNSERAMQAMNWFREIAEQNLNQHRAAAEELLKVMRRMADDFDNQATAIRERSMALSAETMSNTFELGLRLVRLREPQELAQVQSDFISRQAQAIANEAKELNERFMREAEELADAAAAGADAVRRQSKAA